ncbi:MAG TPA: hypothetical protein VHJ82_03595, partial [Actinomycetota bacterium]|nr:hypothetical protein [Actinomycetota bacterium]
MTKTLLPIPIVLLLLGLAACGPFGGDEPLQTMEVEAISGEVEIVRGAEVIAVEEVAALEIDDRIRTGRASGAELRLEGERFAELGELSEARILDSQTLEATRGNLLARPEGDQLHVQFGQVAASATNAVFRIDQGFGAARAATYDGTAMLAAPGERLRITRLFQASIAANDLPGAGSPYSLSLKDPWDIRYLDDIVTLQRDLENLGQGLAGQLRRAQRPGLRYFRALADQNVSFMRDELDRPTPDLLIGFAVADNAPGPLPGTFERTFNLFDSFEGAGQWGVVAGIVRAEPRPVLAQLTDIIEASNIVATTGSGGEAVFTVAAAEEADTGVEPRRPGNGGNPPPEDPEDPEEPKPTPTPTECELTDPECNIGKVFPSPSPTNFIEL